MGDRLMNEGPKWVIFAIWILINFAVFIGVFLQYENSKQYFYLRKLTGMALSFARGSATVLNLNCMLIILPVCRNLLTFLRRSCTCCKRNVKRQLDHNIEFHKLCAYGIVFFTAIHYYAHCFNFENLISVHDVSENSTAGKLMAHFRFHSNESDSSSPNPVISSNTNSILEVMKNVPGYTGLIITLCLVLIISSSTKIIRRSYFELFWYTHHLFVIFFIGLLVHGLGGVVKMQTNTGDHDPTFCVDKILEWGKITECPEPVFASGGAQTWKWLLAPIIIYLVERAIRMVRRFQKVTVTKVTMHPSKVLELRMQKSGFNSTAGQYIKLQCSQISQLEWHPFTLTSAPQDDYIGVHIRLVGDWTEALAEAFQQQANEQNQQELMNSPKISIDGPFGTCSEDAYSYQVDVLIGAGIGVTPFASIIKDLCNKYRESTDHMKLQKVYFFWICPNVEAFEWFGNLLKSMEHQLRDVRKEAFLDYNIYLTRGWDTKMAQDIASREDDVYDCLTGLRQKTHYGRPEWDSVFSDIAAAHEGVRIGVFFCGPKSLSKSLLKTSNKHSSSDRKGTHFVYNQENF